MLFFPLFLNDIISIYSLLLDWYNNPSLFLPLHRPGFVHWIWSSTFQESGKSHFWLTGGLKGAAGPYLPPADLSAVSCSSHVLWRCCMILLLLHQQAITQDCYANLSLKPPATQSGRSSPQVQYSDVVHADSTAQPAREVEKEEEEGRREEADSTDVMSIVSDLYASVPTQRSKTIDPAVEGDEYANHLWRKKRVRVSVWPCCTECATSHATTGCQCTVCYGIHNRHAGNID